MRRNLMENSCISFSFDELKYNFFYLLNVHFLVKFQNNNTFNNFCIFPFFFSILCLLLSLYFQYLFFYISTLVLFIFYLFCLFYFISICNIYLLSFFSIYLDSYLYYFFFLPFPSLLFSCLFPYSFLSISFSIFYLSIFMFPSNFLYFYLHCTYFSFSFMRFIYHFPHCLSCPNYCLSEASLINLFYSGIINSFILMVVI